MEAERWDSHTEAIELIRWRLDGPSWPSLWALPLLLDLVGVAALLPLVPFDSSFILLDESFSGGCVKTLDGHFNLNMTPRNKAMTKTYLKTGWCAWP